jgi:two-component system response regulator RegX3
VSGRILLVDDDPGIVDVVAYGLVSEGFDVEAVRSGEDALTSFAGRTWDVVILDLMLPGISGTEVCRRLRSSSSVPILMLTARDAELDRVLGLELGADDYVTKPFSLAELVSRVRAILRRRELDRREGERPVKEVGGLRIDLMRHQVTVEGRPAALTPSEFRILALLASRPDQVFTRGQILEQLSETPLLTEERACDVHVFKLRRKIEDDPRNPRRILTVRGVGYRLTGAERA